MFLKSKFIRSLWSALYEERNISAGQQLDILVKLDEERTTTRSSSGVNCDTPYVFTRGVIYDFMQVEPCLRAVCVARRLLAPLLHGVQTNAQIKLIRLTRTRARRMPTHRKSRESGRLFTTSRSTIKSFTAAHRRRGDLAETNLRLAICTQRRRIERNTGLFKRLKR